MDQYCLMHISVEMSFAAESRTDWYMTLFFSRRASHGYGDCSFLYWNTHSLGVEEARWIDHNHIGTYIYWNLREDSSKFLCFLVSLFHFLRCFLLLSFSISLCLVGCSTFHFVLDYYSHYLVHSTMSLPIYYNRLFSWSKSTLHCLYLCPRFNQFRCSWQPGEGCSKYSHLLEVPGDRFWR